MNRRGLGWGNEAWFESTASTTFFCSKMQSPDGMAVKSDSRVGAGFRITARQQTCEATGLTYIKLGTAYMC